MASTLRAGLYALHGPLLANRGVPRQNATIEGPAVIREKAVDDRTRYDTVKSRLRAMGEGTAPQVHDALDPTPYSVRDAENTLDEMVLAERDEFERVGRVYRWKKSYRFRMEKK